MRPVMQTDFGDHGNCFSACLASLLHLPINDVPNFFEVAGDEAEAWWGAVRDWLAKRGFGIVVLGVDASGRFHGWNSDAFLIISGKSDRGRDHATIWQGGALLHDPHPDGTGIIEPEDVSLLYPIDPAAIAVSAAWIDLEDGMRGVMG